MLPQIQSFESFYGWKLLRDTMGRASGADPGQGGSWWTAAWLLFLAWMFWEQFTYQRLRCFAQVFGGGIGVLCPSVWRRHWGTLSIVSDYMQGSCDKAVRSPFLLT